jgi:hypothetical protein
MTFTSLFQSNPNIVINTDIDGVLSGVLLVKYCNCNIVGFTNSKDKVWLDNDHNDLYANVYVDMFVTNSNAICIDQHIVAIDKQHIESIKESRLLFSPQHEDDSNLRFFDKSGFENKYPFGTFQYLISVLEREGIIVNLPDMFQPVPNSEIKVGDLLNRPDDAMRTTLYAYTKNANFWWDWLEERSPNGGVHQLKNYLDLLGQSSDDKVNSVPRPNGKRHLKKEYESQREKDVDDIKKKTVEYFVNNFHCSERSKDGGFNNVVDESGQLLENIKLYIQTMAGLFGLDHIELPEQLNLHEGKYCRTCWLDIFPRAFFDNYVINNHQVFSYAFIYSPSNDGQPNFSFTVDMK